MRRLVERGPHTVTVTPMLVSRDALGTSLAPGEPVRVEGVMIQPVSEMGGGASDQAAGVVSQASWRVIGAGTWPGGPYSTIHVEAGPPGLAGRDFQQSGEAMARASGRRTAHFTVTMTALGVEET